MRVPQFLADKGIKRIVGLDYETYYSSDFSLTKLSTTEYVRSPQFFAQGVAIRTNDQTSSTWYTADNIAEALRRIDWSTTALLAHNTHFDGSILSHHYNCVPRYFLDTRAMARGMLPHHISVSLDSVGQYLDLGAKIKGTLLKLKGTREPTPEMLEELGVYAKQDVDLMWAVFEDLLPDFPAKELDLIDLTVRLYADPILEGDIDIAQTELDSIRLAKQQTLEGIRDQFSFADTEQARTNLSSNAKFAALLEQVGVSCPTKFSEKQDKDVPALAKADLDFQELLNHEDENVVSLCEARLAIKSTIGEARAERFILHSTGGKLPIFLNMYGAHTMRWSGGDKFNPQNFPRYSKLKEAIRAPKGYKVMTIDSAQIEARCLAYLAQQQELLDEFSDPHKDPYITMASLIYSKSESEVTKPERFVGKVAVLGLGYGMGSEKFRDTLASGSMGLTVNMSPAEANRIKNIYRSKNYAIVNFWKELEIILSQMISGSSIDAWNMTFESDAVLMPNGLYIHYPQLRAHYDDERGKFSDFTYQARNSRTNIYGGKFAENLVQSYSRSIVGEQILRIAERYRVVLAVHDECVFLVPDTDIHEAKEFAMKCFRTAPIWAGDIPLDAEIGVDDYYTKG